MFEPPCIIWLIRSGIKKWAGQVARMWMKRNAYTVLVRNEEQLEDQGVNSMIILDWIVGVIGGRVLDFSDKYI